MFSPFVSDRLKKNRPKSCTVRASDWLASKEAATIDYLQTTKIFSGVIDFNRLRQGIKMHPEPGLYLLRLLGIAIWYDTNFDSDNLTNYTRYVRDMFLINEEQT